jgi:predicted glycosyltransferase
LPGAEICFLATSKSGLGHLRRTATIARSLRRQAPGRVLRLVSNARPEGLEPEDMAIFDTVHIAERAAMPTAFPAAGRRTLVLDTMTVPGIERLSDPLVLILREAPVGEMHRFRLEGGRPWDQLIVANPRGHWMPEPSALAARAVLPVGWIYRATGLRQGPGPTVPRVLVATGGGGTADTALQLYGVIDDLLRQARRAGAVFHAVQAVGPRAQGFGRLDQADEVVDPGGLLNAQFRDADVVLSTAGYNSVLELATTDTPVLLLPIPRSIDDQTARARAWAPRLGAWHDPAAPDAAADWLVRQVADPQRRAPVDLGESGERLAASAILSLG